MDFKKLVDKKVIWAGEFLDGEGYTNMYVLMDSGEVLCVPRGDESDLVATILDDGLDVLQGLYEDKKECAEAVLRLGVILSSLNASAPTQEPAPVEEIKSE